MRAKEHQHAIWQALQSGVVDILVPITRRTRSKKKPNPIPARLPACPACKPGSRMLDHVHKGRLSIERFVDLTSHGPARIFAIAQKAASPKALMPISPFDLKKQRVIENGWIESNAADAL